MNKTLLPLRIVFILLCTAGGWLVCYTVREWDNYRITASSVGFCIGALVVLVDVMLKGFTGKSARELLGPRDVTMTQATTALGAAIGKPDLKYVQFPYADAEKAMIGMGLTADLAGLFIEMYRGFNEGVMAATEKRSAANTTPTDISQFAKVFAEIYLKS